VDKILFKINKVHALIFIILFLLIAVAPCFACGNDTAVNLDENGTIALESASHEDLLSASKDYYFDASLDDDSGDGSMENPYKYLTADRIKANANIHLANGEYELDHTKSIQQVNVYGQDSARTVIRYDGIAFEVWNSLTLTNLTICDATIVNYRNLNATNVIFTYGWGNVPDSYGNTYGGAICCPYYSDEYNPGIYIQNSTFTNNFAVYGGAIYMDGGRLDITDSQFLDNFAYNFGGCLACEHGTRVSISKSKFTNSRSIEDAGGAIYLLDSSLEMEDVDISNSSATFGGAIVALGTDASISRLTAHNNSAKWDGGAIYQMYGTLSLFSSDFNNNSAMNGGALFVDNSTGLRLRSNVFVNNAADSCGGAVYSICNILIGLSSVRQWNTYIGNVAAVEKDAYELSSVNLNIGDGNYEMYVGNFTEITDLPSYYSLRDYNLLTIPKDQQSSGNCWAFTAIAVLESAILKASGNYLDLSEENMKNLMARFSDYGWKIDTNDGGYDPMPIGYLTSWLGPVNEQDDMFDDKGALSPILKSIMHVQNVVYLKRDNYLDNDAIKRAILNYGAVGTSMLYDSNFFRGNGYYCWYSSSANHAVTIVGWDDNYSRDNFYGLSEDKGDGAWIVRNSWGSDWNDEGYFYVSYYDEKFAQPGVNNVAYAIVLNDTVRYDRNYQYDISGRTSYYYTSSPEIWYKNVFTADGNEFLRAISTYFEKATNWTASVYINGEIKAARSGTSNPGYYTFDLGESILLKTGDVFEVAFKVSGNDLTSVPISMKDYLNRIIYKEGVSFYSLDGENWNDFYYDAGRYAFYTYTSQVACIKAFTVLRDAGTALYLDVGSKNITAWAFDAYDNILNDGNVTFNINGIDYEVAVVNGTAVLPNPLFNQSCNFINAIFNHEYYTSSSNATTFEIAKTQIGLSLNISRDFNNVNITLTSSSRVNESLTVTINGVSHPVDLRDGLALLQLFGLENNLYDVEVGNDPLSLYEFDSIEDSFVVNIAKSRIISADMITDEGSGDMFNITLADEDGEILAQRDLEIILNGAAVSKRTDSNGNAFIPMDLAAGTYEITIRFNGDSDHFGCSSTNVIRVKSVILIGISIVKSQNNVAVDINLSKRVNESLTVNVANKSYSLKTVNGKASLDLPNLENGNYAVNVSLDDDENISCECVESGFVVDVKRTDILADDIVMCEDESIEFNVTLVDENGCILPNKVIFFILNGVEYNRTTDSNGHVGIPIALDCGEYDISVAFRGDDDFFNSTATRFIKVKSNIVIHNSIRIFLNSACINISLSKPINESLTVNVANRPYSIRTVDGKALLNLTNLTNGDYSVCIYMDNEYDFNSSSVNFTFTIDARRTEIISGDLLILDGVPKDYSISLIDENGFAVANRTVFFVLNGKTYNRTTDEEGVAILPVNLTLGQYPIDISFEGDERYYKSDKSNSIVVKANVTINVEVIGSKQVKIDMSKKVNATLCVAINSTCERIGMNGNSLLLDLPKLDAGNYNLTVYILEDNLYESGKVSYPFTIDVKNTMIVLSDLVTYYRSGKEYIAVLMDDEGNPLADRMVDFNLSGNVFSKKTDGNGRAIVDIDLANGEYVVNVCFEGDKNYFASSNSSKITVKSTVIATDSQTKTYGASYVFRLLDNDGNPLKNAQVSYIFNNVVCNGVSDADGNVFVKITQGSGDYSLTIINQVNGETLSKTINVVKRIAQNGDRTVYAFSNAVYSVLVLDDNGKSAGANEIVFFSIAGKTYSVKTDNTGHASFKINLKANKYTITVSYKGYSVSNKITVKPVLTANDISKKKAKSYRFSAKLVDKTGKPLKGKKITFKIKGKKYVAKTNKKGIAKITIKLRLKVGTYKIYSSYGKSKIVNKIRIKK
jgi:predicted outer membrane repeat protein